MQRIPSLDGLRAISITLVMLGHLVKWGHISLPILGSYDSLGVHVFFVLSGYLITKLLLNEYESSSTITLGNFYLRRAFRILPAALGFLGVVTFLHWHEMRWWHMATAVLYVANMDNSRPWMFGHLWSLSIEEQFYLIWPLALKKWYRHRTGMLLFAMAMTPLFRICLYALKMRNGVTGSLPAFADQLAIGCLLAAAESRLPKISKRIAALMVFAAALIPWFPASTPARTVFMLFVLRPVLDVCLAGLVLHVIQVPYRALNWAPVAWLGKISYSLYLWQQLFCSNPGYHFGYSLLLPAFACACISYYAVEKPILLLRERRFQGNLASVRANAELIRFGTPQLRPSGT